MEGVGARLGRSSTRYGPATVFTGPVRKWKKRWIPYTPPNNSSNGTNHNHQHHHHHPAANNGTVNGGNGSHLLLYKWAPITPSQNGNNGNGNGKNDVENNDDSKDDVVGGDDEQQRRKRKFKYIPVAVLEEQKNEASEHGEDEAIPMETETDGMEQTSKSDGFDGKPDINDIPAEESQVHENNSLERQDLNESTLDLSLGLKAHDGENDSDSKTNQKRDG